MASELTPGQIAKVFERLTAEAHKRSGLALEPLAIAIETQAKINASNGSHRYGTKSPASPGNGPAIISGALRRTITHTLPVPTGTGWTAMVGMAAGVYHPHPPYPVPGTGKRKAKGKGAAVPVSKVAQYLEEAHNYPFLQPAFQFGVTIAAPTIYKSVFGAPWGPTA